MLEIISKFFDIIAYLIIDLDILTPIGEVILALIGLALAYKIIRAIPTLFPTGPVKRH